MDPNVPQPNFFSFSKSLHSNSGNSGSFFAFLFRLVGILKLAAILSHFGQILARNCGPSPRFTNRVQFYILDVCGDCPEIFLYISSSPRVYR